MPDYRLCKNCNDYVHTPDDRTGLIHRNNKYLCRSGKPKKNSVAE